MDKQRKVNNLLTAMIAVGIVPMLANETKKEQPVISEDEKAEIEKLRLERDEKRRAKAQKLLNKKKRLVVYSEKQIKAKKDKLKKRVHKFLKRKN